MQNKTKILTQTSKVRFLTLTAVLSLALAGHLLVDDRLRHLVEGQTDTLVDEGDNNLHDCRHAQEDVGGALLATEDLQARVGDANDEEGQASSGGHDDAVLSLSNVALVGKGDGDGDGEKDDDDDHEDDADLAEGGVVDLGEAAAEGVTDVVSCLGAADDGQDDGHDHEQLHDVVVDGTDDDVALAVDGLEDACEQAEVDEHEGS